MPLHNIYDKETLRKQLDAEPFARKTVSFYRYVYLEEVDQLRDVLYAEWSELGVLGRIYIAREGINAQISVPEPNWERFLEVVYARPEFANTPMKIAVEDDGKSFLKLILKVRKNIVADGLAHDEYDVTNVGTHLSAEEFNAAMQDPDTVVVDMRNHYESEVGHFDGAILPDVDTFREQLPLVADMLKGKEDTKVLLYCTGGIRCEKASAFLRYKGFEDVNQLHGGIIDYARQIKEKELDSKFIGKNFVFDERLGERITDDVIATCHQCGSSCDTHINCANEACHLLFIQCDACSEKFEACCSSECQSTLTLAEKDRAQLRKKHPGEGPAHYRARPGQLLGDRNIESSSPK